MFIQEAVESTDCTAPHLKRTVFSLDLDSLKYEWTTRSNARSRQMVFNKTDVVKKLQRIYPQTNQKVFRDTESVAASRLAERVLVKSKSVDSDCLTMTN